jgi:hypothetical protein
MGASASGGSNSGGSDSGGSGQGGNAGRGGAGGGCSYNGMHYAEGESFPAGDGCNTCSCDASGSVGCTEIGCDSCVSLESEYVAAYGEAKSCDPMLSVEQCTALVFAGLVCGCETFFNKNKVDAIANVSALKEKYDGAGCGKPVLCEQCQPPKQGFCSSDGVCQDAY